MSGKISIIIPCFNEERTIETILGKVLSSDTLGLSREVILVNDGSTDSTRKNLKKFENDIRIIDLPVNSGKGNAVKEGLRYATGSIFLIQDADLEYDPADYPVLLRPFTNPETQVVYGVRKHDHFPRSYFLNPYFWGGRSINLLLNLASGGSLKDVHTGYKVFRSSSLEIDKLSSKRFSFCHELTLNFLERGLHITEQPITYRPRTIAEGKKIRFRDGLEATGLILSSFLRNKLK